MDFVTPNPRNSLWLPVAVAIFLLCGPVLPPAFTRTALDAAHRSWLPPGHVTAPPWSASVAGWRGARAQPKPVSHVKVRPILVRAAGAGIVVNHLDRQALVAVRGLTTVPLFSPVLRPAFDHDASFPHVLAHLRHANIRFVALTVASPMTQKLVKAHPFWNTLCHDYRPNAMVGSPSIFYRRNLEPGFSAVSAP